MGFACANAAAHRGTGTFPWRLVSGWMNGLGMCKISENARMASVANVLRTPSSGEIRRISTPSQIDTSGVQHQKSASFGQRGEWSCGSQRWGQRSTRSLVYMRARPAHFYLRSTRRFSLIVYTTASLAWRRCGIRRTCRIGVTRCRSIRYFVWLVCGTYIPSPYTACEWSVHEGAIPVSVTETRSRCLCG
jgi:hypothetical protein